jgi:hypothetical protein
MATKNNQFSLTLPEGWTDTTAFTFQGPNDSGVQHNLVIVIDPAVEKGIDLKTYATQQIDNSKVVLPGFELINEKEKTMPSGIEAYEIVYKYIPADEVIIFQKQVFMFIGGKGYSFTSSFSKKTLKTIANEVDEIIASFVPKISDNEEDY